MKRENVKMDEGSPKSKNKGNVKFTNKRNNNSIGKIEKNEKLIQTKKYIFKARLTIYF